jgi:hypothetical protein
MRNLRLLTACYEMKVVLYLIKVGASGKKGARLFTVKLCSLVVCFMVYSQTV